METTIARLNITDRTFDREFQIVIRPSDTDGGYVTEITEEAGDARLHWEGDIVTYITVAIALGESVRIIAETLKDEADGVFDED